MKIASRTESRPASRFAGRRIHFIGIGGSGMCGLARMLLDAGAMVTGSEPRFNAQTAELVRRGATISRDQFGQLLTCSVDLVVRTAAVASNNREFIAAKALNLKQVKYAEMLGMVMSERQGIAVAGTHGKSTTTAMIGFALLECGADPSFVIGGTVRQLNGSSRSGNGAVFVAEACEFDRSFHNLHPQVGLITNVDEDHLDYYKDGIDEIVASFRKFAELVPPGGVIIANGQDERVLKALSGLTTPIELVALTPGFAWSCEVGELKNGCPTGKVSYKGEVVGVLELAIPGEHNLHNATMAVAACAAVGIGAEKSIPALNRFAGVDRRMSVMGQCNGAMVLDDYGHHPTEIRATLKALREKYSPSRLVCVFQPHQHSRTRFLLEDFAASFKDADEVIVPDIYFVRDSEAERQKVSAGDLVSRINSSGQKAIHFSAFPEIIGHLKATLKDGELVVTMGAGNVWEIASELADK